MMTLVNGKFFNDGAPYPLEFGNKDQLKLIEKVKVMRTDGIAPYLVPSGGIGFLGIGITCVCGSKVYGHLLEGEEMEDMIGRKIKCDGCKFNYVVCSDDYDFPYFKLI